MESDLNNRAGGRRRLPKQKDTHQAAPSLDPAQPKKIHLRCPTCRSDKTRVRHTEGCIRYRECCHCKHTFKTVEST